MTIHVSRNRAARMQHTISVRQHVLLADEPQANGGDDTGPTPHDLYDSALGACKAMTVLWYARRKQIPLEGVDASVERDDSAERQGLYRLRVTLALSGPLTPEQRQELLAVASRCPVHKLMTQATTEVVTALGPDGSTAA